MRTTFDRTNNWGAYRVPMPYLSIENEDKITWWEALLNFFSIIFNIIIGKAKASSLVFSTKQLLVT